MMEELDSVSFLSQHYVTSTCARNDKRTSSIWKKVNDKGSIIRCWVVFIFHAIEIPMIVTHVSING
jgi:hypothetical protein